MRTITALPPELTKLLFDAGTRVIVLVEGEDDCDVLRHWFSEQRPALEFYDCGGSARLEPLLNELLKRSSFKRAYAIGDRDFRTAAEVETSYAVGSHLFILKRYALENYLFELSPLWQTLHERHPDQFTNEAVVSHKLLELCRKLKSVMSANWLFFEANLAEHQRTGVWGDIEYLSVGYEPQRETVLPETSLRLGCTESEADTRLAGKEGLIDSQLTQLETAHEIIDGKRLLHWVRRDLFKTADDDYLRRRLIRENKLAGVQADLRALVLERILKT